MSEPARPSRKPRGVQLNALDRSRQWVIGYTGRRWEVVGPLDAPAAPDDCATEAGPPRASEAARGGRRGAAPAAPDGDGTRTTTAPA